MIGVLRYINQGFGVVLFKDCKASNTWMFNRKNLSCSQWTTAIKLNSNYANLNGVIENSNTQNTLCRRCNREKETPSHVLDICSSNERLITVRHNAMGTFATPKLP